MSALFNADNDQLKVTLSSALTIGTGDFVTAAWIYMTTATDVALFWALVDVDPNATVSKRVWTDAANADITADEDAGGVSPYTLTTGTWYYVVYQRASGWTNLRIFNDTSSTTPLADNGAGDVANLTTLDTIIIGDIEPSSRVAFKGEIISLKVQTVSGGWTDSEARTESQYFAIQKAGGTDRYAWRLETVDADTNGLYEIGGSGPNFSGIGGTVTAGSNRPSQLQLSVTREQEGFRWVNDDGSESASTFAASQDTNITAAAAATRRLRVLVNATGDPPTTAYKLQWRISGGSWADIA